MKKYIILLLLIVSAQSFAVLHSRLQLLGFSANGQYMSYQVSGYDDGTGRYECRIYFVDVNENKYLEKPIQIFQTQTTLSQICQLALKQAQPRLDQYGIKKDNQGKLLFQDALLPEMVPFLSFKAVKTASITLYNRFELGIDYQIDLIEREISNTACLKLKKNDLKPKIFELVLKKGDWVKVLQKDQVLYPSRNCPFAYGIHKIYYYQGKIAVFLHSWTQGYEGTNVYKLVVTAQIQE